MATFAYQLSFPCPECQGILTMRTNEGLGQCPLCRSHIKVSLSVEKTSGTEQPETSNLGWDKRAFRRPATAEKPMWQPTPQPAE